MSGVRHIDLNGTQLAYRIDGDGPRLFLLLNGASCVMATWGQLADDLASLGRVIRYDRRGSGASSAGAGPTALATHAADAVALLDALAIERVILIGHAFGGRLAQMIAVEYPERVAGLVLCGTGGRFPPLPPRAVPALPDGATERERWNRDLLARFFAPGSEIEQTEAVQRTLDRLWAEREARQRHGARAAGATPEPVDAWWGRATAPSLLLYGTEDRQGHEQNARDLAASLSDARLVMIEGASHFGIVEQPERYVAELQMWLHDRGL